MSIFRKHLLFSILITLFTISGNIAEKSSFYDGTFMQNEFSQSNNSINYRLSPDVKPILYEIILIPNFEDFTFKGFLKIDATVERPTNNVTLHVGNITIEAVTVVILEANTNLYTSYDNVTEKFTIFLPEILQKDTDMTITFTYNGILSDNMIGFYRSSYFENRKIKWLAATQFQTTHARHAFPCFDEPGFKAKFIIRIARDDNYVILSNMPLKQSEQLKPGSKIFDTFEESIPMSTYLVAFIISEFSFLNSTEDITAEADNNITEIKNKIAVWSKPSTINQAAFALKISTEVLKLYENKFNESYSLKKMDMVAVPDFAAGAMENWGLITYRESRMLYDEKESSTVAQQSVVSVIAHELTHMWFGNLVTPKWWSYLWLSEAFARYFQYFGTAELTTEKSNSWKEQFVIEQHQSALIADGLESSLPMTREVSSKSQVAGIGDTITYNKGASIVRMMNLVFGPDIFENALRSYIQNNKEKGLAEPDALWAEIKDQINKMQSVDPSLKSINVKTTMDTWTTKAGYPVISIAINDNGILNITQERFLLRNLYKTPTDVVWSIPLTFATKSKPDFNKISPKYWLSTNKSNAYLKIDPKEWAIFNVQSSGFYRVNYNSRGWRNILNTLKSSNNLDEIHVLNRAGIVDDLLNLGRAGYQNYNMILDGLLYLKRETNYLPFKAAFNGFKYLNKRFSGNFADHSLLKEYILSLVENIRLQLGYEDHQNDDRLKILLRQEVNNWLCNYDDDECVTIYTNKFKKWKVNPNARIKPNERTTAYCVAIRYGTYEDWDFLWKEYVSSNYPADQLVILNALGCSQNISILERYLNSAITSFEVSCIRKQDSTSVFAAVYNSGLLGAEYVLDFVEKYYKQMEKYYGGQNTIATILDGASQSLSTHELVSKFEKLINNDKIDFASIQTSLNSSLRIAKYELEWYNIYSPIIIQWLRLYTAITYRLPTNISPKRYVISVKPYLEPGNFFVDGKVTIEATVIQPTSQIILHSSEIKIHSVNVTVNQKKIDIFKTEIRSQYDFYKIYLMQELTSGTNVVIDIKYEGHLNATELRGFYKSSYINEKGETRWLAASHLEPVGARKMFPCFDEPAMKAVFTIKVSVPQGYHAISNMNWWKVQKIDDRILYHFYESKLMSTYLVAVVVSDFKYQFVDKNKFAVFARPNAINQTDYALSLMSPLLNFFETTYNQKYQLPKLYMAALPDFGAGAMENWGLLTYRESSMLYDEKHSPITNKRDIRNVIAHEISHQWFGNLVSPLWWKYLWLNEGFARYFEYYAPAYVFKDKTMESQFVVDQVHSAFSVDSFNSTHPMSHDVATVREIRGIFDTITYAKGGSILRMIEKTYGTEVFNNALSDYLNKQKYNVATPEDLYASLQFKINEKGIKDNITVIWDTWTTQSGYPVLNVKLTKDFISMEQKRFFFKAQEDNSNNAIWHIPITWASVQNSSDYLNTTPKIWLKTKTMKIPTPSNSSLIFNTQQSGYYRVNYDKEHWLKLIDYLQNQNINTIHEINRAALIDDLMNLARADVDYVNYKTVISATIYLRKETNYFPWRAFFNNLAYLNNRFAGRDIESLYKKWLTSLIKPLYEKLSFEDLKDDDDLTEMFRIHTRKWACKLDIADCKFYAAKYFQIKLLSYDIPPNYRDVVYCTAMKIDKTNNTYQFLWKEYLNSNVNTDKLVILNSLACSENKDVLETLLRNAVTEESVIRYQDMAKVFSSVYDASLVGVEAVMKTIETNYDALLQRHFNDHSKIGNIMSALASRLSTYDLYNKYQKLINWLVKREPKFTKSVKSYLSIAKYEFNWYENKVPVIFEALDNIYSSNTYRLPKTLSPTWYNIYLTPHMENGTFEGKAEIHIRVEKDTSLIVLNSHKLEILNVNVTRNGTNIPYLNYTNRIPHQLKIYLNAYIHTNENITVTIQYNGILNDDMNGFYRSSYFDNGKQYWLATTHFEPIYARQAFPCFDEPAFKSKFVINIQRPNDYHSRSNMPLSNKYKEPTYPNYTWDIFDITDVNMSTYLVAFVISKFQPVNNSNSFFNVWGRPEVAAHGKYAQDIGMEILDKLQNITAINYTLPKLDLVGIPDFSMGAMENWGLVTFREYGLFYNKEETTSTYEKFIINVIAHELSHMWFGNLVTCDWWDYIWLNEGFAQYFEWYTSDLIRPEYKFMDQFVVYELQPALAKDASISTHPMTNPVSTPEEIDSIFDYVTYGKSASVLRMIFNKFDKEDYILALRDYLTERKYRTARPIHLWESFEKYLSIPINNRNTSVEEIMSTWTNQPGYPVVNATLIGSVLRLSQERFLINKNATVNEFYWIPIDIVVESNSYNLIDDVTLDHKVWLGPNPIYIILNSINDWFIVNYKQTGFYRVNYDTYIWDRLIYRLKIENFEAIHVLNRAQIIDDLFNLARANYVDYGLLMSATQYLKRETNHLPWKAFFNGLSFIYEKFEQHVFEEDLNEYVLDLLSNMYDKVGFDDRDDENHLDKLNREVILQWACKLNKKECVKRSIDLFSGWRNDVSRISPNARPAVYCTAIKENKTTDDWNFLWNKYLQSNFATEKKIIINALGCSRNKQILLNYLRKAIEKYNPATAAIRRQDVSAVFSSVYSAGPIGVNVTLTFLMANTEELYKYFGKWDDIINLVINVASHISSIDQYNMLERYIEDNINIYPSNTRTKLRSALTIANTNLLWFQNNGPKIRQWIMSNFKKPKPQQSNSSNIRSLSIVFTTLIALISYLFGSY